jgi:hypothetical protein
VQPSWTLSELVDAVAAVLASSYDGPPNGRVRDIPDARTIRYYTTLGLIDGPAAMKGRTALYGERHLLQLVAIKRLQARGLSLASVQEQLLGLPSAALRRLAAVPHSGVKPTNTAGAAQRFWAAVPEPAAATPAAAIEPATGKAPPFLGVPLGGGATLLLHDHRVITDGDLAAIHRAAQPLLDLLSALGLAGARTERHNS